MNIRCEELLKRNGRAHAGAPHTHRQPRVKAKIYTRTAFPYMFHTGASHLHRSMPSSLGVKFWPAPPNFHSKDAKRQPRFEASP